MAAGIGEADGVGDEVEEDLADALRVDMEGADVLRDGHFERDLLLGQAVAQAFDRRARDRRDVRLADVERHDAGVDGGEVEDVVDEGEQRARRRIDVVHVFALLRIEAAGRLVRQQLGKADDGLQRRAQLVGDVLDEVGFQPVGRLQRLVALGQHALDAGRIRHVDEGQHGHAFGKRDGGVVDDAAVGPLHAADRLVVMLEVGDGGADLVPGLLARHRSPGSRR